MAIEAGTKFITYSPDVDLKERRSSGSNSKTEVYTIEEIAAEALPSVDGSAGEVLKTDGAGTTYWDTVGGGKVGISDSNGIYTYYDTIALANTAATAGDTIVFFTNIVETTTTEFILKDGVNYNLNGYTYENSNAGTNNAITDNNVAVNCTIYNGVIKRTGGVSSLSNSAALFLDNTNSVLNLDGVEFNSDFGYACLSDAVIDGGRFIGAVGGYYSRNTAGANRKLSNAYCYGGTEYGLYSNGELFNVVGESNTGIGGRVYAGSGLTGKALNCSFYSKSGYGLQANGGVFENCSSRSDGSTGCFANTGTNDFLNCSFYSTSSYGFNCSGSVYVNLTNCTAVSTANYGAYLLNVTLLKTYNCVFKSTANYGAYLADDDSYLELCSIDSNANIALYCTNGKVKNCNVYCGWDNVGGHGISGSTVAIAAEIFDNYIEVKNASANCLYNPNAKSSYIGVNTFKGATTPINANITNSQTNTPDTYGNLTIG